MYTDDDLKDVLGDIARTLESNSAWLSPRSRGSLLMAREIVERVLDRRRTPWPPLVMDATEAAD